MDVGTWYEIELPVTTTKKHTGRLVRIIEAADGKKVYIFQGRFQFSVVEDEMMSATETEPPKTGVKK